MGFKTNLVALSYDVPRIDIIAEEAGSPTETMAEVEKLWPGQYQIEASRTVDDCLYNEFGAAVFGSTLLIAAGDDVDWAFEDPALVADPRDIWALSIHSVTDFCFYKTPTRQLEVSSEDVDFNMERFFAEGSLLDFEVPYARGDHRNVLTAQEVQEWEELKGKPARRDKDGEYSWLFHPLDLGNSAVLWMFGIQGETPPDDEVMASLPPTDHVLSKPMFTLQYRR